MQQKCKAVILSTFVCFTLALAADEDTTKIYNAKEVVVTATRSTISLKDAPSPIHVISYESIQRIDGKTVADVLRNVNGASIKDYGAVGGAKQITFRGLSTENVSLLINGNPINDPQYGSMDLSLLPIDAVDHMEISYGGSSALYGGNALGGVVNIITRRASDDLHARVQGEGGSFGTRRATAELQGRFSGVGILTGVARETGDDFFSFVYHRQNQPDTTLYRSNADYRRTNIFVNSDYNPTEYIALNASIQYVKFERGVPGSISYPSPARQNDETFRALIDSKFYLRNNLVFSFNGIYNHGDEIYREPVDYSPTDLFYHSRSYLMNAQIEWLPVSWDRIIGGAEYGEGRLDVNGISWGFPFSMNPDRVQKSAYLSNEITYQNGSEWFDHISLYQTVRYDNYSDVKDDVFSPKLGINLQINKRYNAHIRGSWGKNFRVPTFNDLYYPMYSNPYVLPERSTAFDVGVIGELNWFGNQFLAITYFDISTNDKIVYNAQFVPYNIGKSENSGIEIRYDYHSIDGMVDAYFGLTLINAVKKNKNYATDSTYGKQLQNVPKSLGTFGLSFETYIGRININQSITGVRYTNADNSKSMPAYALTDVNISKKISLSYIQLTIRFSVSNVFDADYQVVEGYPSCGRAYKAGFSLDY